MPRTKHSVFFDLIRFERIARGLPTSYPPKLIEPLGGGAITGTPVCSSVLRMYAYLNFFDTSLRRFRFRRGSSVEGRTEVLEFELDPGLLSILAFIIQNYSLEQCPASPLRLTEIGGLGWKPFRNNLSFQLCGSYGHQSQPNRQHSDTNKSTHDKVENTRPLQSRRW